MASPNKISFMAIGSPTPTVVLVTLYTVPCAPFPIGATLVKSCNDAVNSRPSCIILVGPGDMDRPSVVVKFSLLAWNEGMDMGFDDRMFGSLSGGVAGAEDDQCLSSPLDPRLNPAGIPPTLSGLDPNCFGI